MRRYFRICPIFKKIRKNHSPSNRFEFVVSSNISMSTYNVTRNVRRMYITNTLKRLMDHDFAHFFEDWTKIKTLSEI